MVNFILLEFYLRKKERSMLGFPGGSVVKNPPANAGDSGRNPGYGRAPGVGNATHSSILAWEISWTEEPCYNNPRGRKRIRRNLVTKQQHLPPSWKERLSVCLCPSQLKITNSNCSACAACLVHSIQPSDARACTQPVLFNCRPSSSSSTLCPHLTRRRKRLLHLFNRQLATSQKLPIGGEHPSVFIWVLSAETRLY